MNSNRFEKLIELLLFVTVASLYFYAFTHRAFGFYFDLDDVHNLSWSHFYSVQQFFIDSVDFSDLATVDTYRPIGALFYNLCYRAFGIDFPKFHSAAMILHLLNASLVFVLIRHFVKDLFSAFIGGIAFTFHIALLPAYWQFSTIFDVLCAFLMLLSFICYIRITRPLSIPTILSLLLFFFACRTKEMAFALPPILLLYELSIGRQDNSPINTKTIIKKLIPFFVMSLALGIPKLYAGYSVGEKSPYVVVFGSFLEGVLFYGNLLFQNELESLRGAWVAVLTGILALVHKNKCLQFAFAYIFISILPVLFLPNHRHGFYGYISFFGVALYISELLALLQRSFSKTSLLRKGIIYGIACMFLFIHAKEQMQLKKGEEELYLKDAQNIRSFIHLMQTVRPGNDSLFLFDSAPDRFDKIAVTSSVHLVYDDYSIKAKVISNCNKIDFPVENPEVYCVSHRERRIYTIRSRSSL